jgi:eukaryotic-like serine/threonine-protein kinase
MATSTDRTQPLTAAPHPLTASSPGLTPGQTPAPAPVRNTPAPKFGLAWRIFLGIALVVVVVLVVTLAVASTVASNAADESIRVGLEQTGQRVSDILASQRDGMLRRSQLFAAQPSFRSTIGGAIAANDSATLLDQAITAADQIGASWTQIIGADGIRLAKSDDPAADRIDLNQSALVSGALEGKPTAGFGVLSDTLLFDAVALRTGDNALSPILMAAHFITDTLAKTIGQQTGTDLVFYAVNREHKRELTISPAKFGARSELRGVIENAMMPSNATGAMDAHNMMMTSSERRDITLGGRHYVGQHVELLSASGGEVGGFIALRDKDKELAAYYKLRNTLLLTGLGGILIAFLLSLLISRQIVRPVTLLVGATQRAADGDYNADIPVASSDEIGTLAQAFKRLLADLRDKQALVEFLQSPAGGRTVAVHQITPTMAMEAMGTMAAVLEPGQTLAVRYEIRSVLGVGGMGMVYKAVDRELGETIAVKTLKPEMMQQDPSVLERFKSEIKLARRIAHRNVVRTYDLGENGGVYFITMEFVEGKSLKELIQSRGRLPVSVTLPIAKQLCRALEVAHEEGVIHRDIKPQNMVVQPDGVLKVMDFGIARLAQRTTGHTQAGMVVGTPEYMAPEQLFGEEIDQRADLYAAGAVIYECLTGRLPHEADTPMTLIAKVIEETPRPPRELQPDVPAALSEIVMRTLSKDRDKRPKSASELHDWLLRWESGEGRWDTA